MTLRERTAALQTACETALRFIYDCETSMNGIEAQANRVIDTLEAALATLPTR